VYANNVRRIALAHGLLAASAPRPAPSSPPPAAPKEPAPRAPEPCQMRDETA
jgi:hypothetical protein